MAFLGLPEVTHSCVIENERKDVHTGTSNPPRVVLQALADEIQADLGNHVQAQSLHRPGSANGFEEQTRSRASHPGDFM